jgi:hypothetical protein
LLDCTVTRRQLGLEPLPWRFALRGVLERIGSAPATLPCQPFPTFSAFNAACCGTGGSVRWSLNHLPWCNGVRQRAGYDGQRLGLGGI